MQWKSLQALTPGLTHLLGYQRSWLKPDIRAGLSVAAVALPVAIAYAELAGVSPVVGLYSCILPMVAYALFGSSRQLIVRARRRHLCGDRRGGDAAGGG